MWIISRFLKLHHLAAVVGERSVVGNIQPQKSSYTGRLNGSYCSILINWRFLLLWSYNRMCPGEAKLLEYLTAITKQGIENMTHNMLIDIKKVTN